MTPSRTRCVRAVALSSLLVVLGCGRGRAVEEAPRALPVDVFADTGRTYALRAEVPEVPVEQARGAAWLARVSPSRGAIPEGPAIDPGHETLSVPLPEPPSLVVEEGLKPPLPRTRVPLAVPAGASGSVELDVRVDEDGTVSDAVWAGGTREPAMVRAAVDCARAMRFYPAQRAGRPVAVWCRERFDFGGEGP